MAEDTNIDQLVEQIEAAEDKDALEAPAKALGKEVNKRKGLETVRAELIEAAEAELSGDQGGDSGDTSGEAQGKKKTAKKSPQEPSKGKTRKLKNINNGRVFAWTAALAKKRNITEV